MPRPRIYADAAERKRASRERIRQRQEAEERERLARPQTVTLTPELRRDLYELLTQGGILPNINAMKQRRRLLELVDHPDYHAKRDQPAKVTKRTGKRDRRAEVTKPETTEPPPLDGQFPIL